MFPGIRRGLKLFGEIPQQFNCGVGKGRDNELFSAASTDRDYYETSTMVIAISNSIFQRI